MKTTRIFAVMVAVLLIVGWSQMAFAEQKTITLPKGTKVEKLGAGHFKFKLPDGQAVEVKSYSKGSGTSAIIGDCGIYDRKGKLTTSGKQGNLKGGPKPQEFLKSDVKSSKDFVKIDDKPTWLPATITYQVVEMKSKQGVKGLSPQPDPPGKK